MAYYCKSCKDDGPCDMHCAHCGTDVFNPNVETFTVVKWIPSEHGGQSVLALSLCVACGERALRPEDSNLD